MLISLSGYCQKDYPYQTVLDGDTVAVLSIGQVRQLNVYFSDWDQCKETNEALDSAMHTLIMADKKQSAAVADLKFQVASLTNAGVMQDRVIIKQEKEIKVQKRSKILAFIAAAVLGVIVIIK